MTEVISVRFKNKGKVYYFDPNGIAVARGDSVIVETAKGLEFAECVTGNHEVEDSAVHPPLRPVTREATPEDIQRAEENRRKEREAMEICRERIAKHGLDMKLVDVEYNFEGTKILFFFTSEGRVDFRELVKDLAGIFKTRIELRQIGVRDEARMLGGLGICGRPFCCAQFLDDFQPVSIKMAKTQGLSLNPTKISDSCGRLMCCLKYEQDAYEELVQSVPKTDAFVETPAGVGTVVDVNLLKGTVRVRLEDQTDMSVRTFEASELTVLGGKAKRAEYLAARAEGLIEAPQKPQPRLRRGPAPDRQEPRQEPPREPRPEPREDRADGRDGKNPRPPRARQGRGDNRQGRHETTEPRQSVTETSEPAPGNESPDPAAREPRRQSQPREGAEGQPRQSQRRGRGRQRQEGKKPERQPQQKDSAEGQRPRQSGDQPREGGQAPREGTEGQRPRQGGDNQRPARRKRPRRQGPRRQGEGETGPEPQADSAE